MNDYSKFEIVAITLGILIGIGIVAALLAFTVDRATSDNPADLIREQTVQEIIRMKIETCKSIEHIDTRTVCLSLIVVDSK
jgi:hypothetical protein